MELMTKGPFENKEKEAEAKKIEKLIPLRK